MGITLKDHCYGSSKLPSLIAMAMCLFFGAVQEAKSIGPDIHSLRIHFKNLMNLIIKSSHLRHTELRTRSLLVYREGSGCYSVKELRLQELYNSSGKGAPESVGVSHILHLTIDSIAKNICYTIYDLTKMGTHGLRAPEKAAVNLEAQRHPLQIHGFPCKLVVHVQVYRVWLSIIQLHYYQGLIEPPKAARGHVTAWLAKCKVLLNLAHRSSTT